MKIEKSQRIKSDDLTCVRLENIISDYAKKMLVGKVVIDEEKITFFKFGIKLATVSHFESGLEYSYEDGLLKQNFRQICSWPASLWRTTYEEFYEELRSLVRNWELYLQLLDLFNIKRPEPPECFL